MRIHELGDLLSQAGEAVVAAAQGSSNDVVGNTLWSFSGAGGLATATNTITKSTLDQLTQQPSNSASAAPFVTTYMESSPGIIVVGNLLYLIGGTDQGAAVPTTATLLK